MTVDIFCSKKSLRCWYFTMLQLSCLNFVTRQIFYISQEVIPYLNDHMEDTCSPQLLGYVKDLVLSRLQVNEDKVRRVIDPTSVILFQPVARPDFRSALINTITPPFVLQFPLNPQSALTENVSTFRWVYTDGLVDLCTYLRCVN